jgi:NADH:ubiquinone oxidoreductase subunit E
MSDRAGAEARAGRFPGPSLIPPLTEIQRRHGWLPREELVALARDWRRPLYEIEGLISFYPHFRTEPPGRTQLAVCHDLSCWLQGGEERLAELRERYGDEVELHEVSCLGRCDDAPAVAVDEQPVPVDEVADALAGRRAPAAALRPGERRPNDPYERDDEHYRVLRRVLGGELQTE